MEVYLVRHAHAGSRTHGPHDRYRPLSDEGREQALALAAVFNDRPVHGVWSSPATRCVQTVEPLAEAAGLEVVEDSALWEDVGLDEVLALVTDKLAGVADRPSPGGLVMCSHGNLIPAVVEYLAAQGAEVNGRGCERASIWKLTTENGRWVEARYLTPRLGYA